MELETYTQRTASSVQRAFDENDALFTRYAKPVDDAYKPHYVQVMSWHGQLRKHQEEFRHACRVAETFLSDFARFAKNQATIDATQRTFLQSVSGRAVIPPQAPNNEPTAQGNLLQERKRLLESILSAITRYNDVIRAVHAYFHQHAKHGFFSVHLGGFVTASELPKEISV